MTLISIDGVSRRFGEVTALDSVSLEIRQGEFFALLGPSGCGKTTLLRILAGFEQPDDGAVRLDGEDLLKIPAHRRPINLMFQSYALFPHMTVERNIAYGLEREKLPKKEIRERVAEVLETVGLAAQARRKPHQLSGGQRQRVALARAIVKRPRLLLLDEPLSALDKKVRAEMQLELKRLQNEVGITFVVVTHDQEEAMSLADRIAVLQGGKVEQVDAPVELYEQPRTPFVAGFIGANNLFSGKVAENGLDVPGLGVLPAPKGVDGDSALLVVRPEKIRLAEIEPAADEPAAVEAGETAEPEVKEGPAESETKADAEAGDEVKAEEAAEPAADTDAQEVVAKEAEAEEAEAEAEVKEGPVKTDEGAEPKAPKAAADNEAETETEAEVTEDAQEGPVTTDEVAEPETPEATEAAEDGSETPEEAADAKPEVAEAREDVVAEGTPDAQADRGDDLRAAVKSAMTGEVNAEAMAEVVSRAVAGVVAKVVAEVVAEVVADNDAKARAKAEEPSETTPAATPETAPETADETAAEAVLETASETADEAAPESAGENALETAPENAEAPETPSGQEPEAATEESAEPEPESPLRGTVVDVSFYGGTSHIVLRVEGHEGHVLAAAQGSARVEVGTEVAIGWDAADAVLIPA
ncbi:polyamine ABC transporter ATP-binding protein [Microtetraspora niveoalba]|uniref:polyamine ABC transporter ATP-binding protein n=1 Tax=Microtetraspora niveoalba TaxID=46175 RepID=UPI000A01E204|nr:polyamine ABC transporter ATP-binding protein [Microtetraspora niveoalba]